MHRRATDLHYFGVDLYEEVRRWLFGEKPAECFTRERKRRGNGIVAVGRNRFVALGINRISALRVDQRGVTIVNPNRVRLVTEESFATDVFAKPFVVNCLDGLDHVVPGRVVIGEGFKRLAIFAKEIVESALGFGQPAGSDFAELFLVECAEGPEAGHENRYHRDQQKRDLGLDFHLNVTTSPCLLSGRGECRTSPYQTAFPFSYSRMRASRIATIFKSSPFPRTVHQFLVRPAALFLVGRPGL